MINPIRISMSWLTTPLELMGDDPGNFQPPRDGAESAWLHGSILVVSCPDAPCMEYFPTFTPQNDPNVGTYSIHLGCFILHLLLGSWPTVAVAVIFSGSFSVKDKVQ